MYPVTSKFEFNENIHFELEGKPSSAIHLTEPRFWQSLCSKTILGLVMASQSRQIWNTSLEKSPDLQVNLA